MEDKIDLKEIISSPLKEIIKRFENSLEKRKDFELGFNIFSLISDTYHRENFHSEIIHSLLNPKGGHKEGIVFLNLFLDYLKEKFNIPIDNSHYQEELNVNNEFGIDSQRRIDILITSKKHAIIIENKINNAVDMENQLVDYYDHCIKRGLIVDAILYLSLDGHKQPDRTMWTVESDEQRNLIESKLKLLSAFNIDTSENSLYYWLKKCEEESKNIDCKVIIKHYKQLLKSLRKSIMETNALKEYYEELSKSENKEKAIEIEKLVDMHNKLIYYYPEKLLREINMDNQIKLYFNDNEIFDPTTVIFKNKEKGYRAYYLKIIFCSNEKCAIYFMDNSGSWLNDDELKKDNEFSKLFSNNNNDWEYKNKKYDLVNNFKGFVEEIEKILSLFSNIVRKSLN